MNSLFELVNEKIQLNPIVLSIQEFEKIWKRDKTKTKDKARKELTYIYGMASTTEDNIWKDYRDMKEREMIIIIDLFGDKSIWVPDRLINEALEKYKQRYPQDEGEQLMGSAKNALMKLKRYLDNINLDDKDDVGRPVHNPKIILELATKATQTYIEMEETMDKLRSRKKLATDRVKGGGKEGFFESSNIMKGLI